MQNHSTPEQKLRKQIDSANNLLKNTNVNLNELLEIFTKTIKLFDKIKLKLFFQEKKASLKEEINIESKNSDSRNLSSDKQENDNLPPLEELILNYFYSLKTNCFKLITPNIDTKIVPKITRIIEDLRKPADFFMLSTQNIEFKIKLCFMLSDLYFSHSPKVLKHFYLTMHSISFEFIDIAYESLSNINEDLYPERNSAIIETGVKLVSNVLANELSKILTLKGSRNRHSNQEVFEDLNSATNFIVMTKSELNYNEVYSLLIKVFSYYDKYISSYERKAPITEVIIYESENIYKKDLSSLISIDEYVELFLNLYEKKYSKESIHHINEVDLEAIKKLLSSFINFYNDIKNVFMNHLENDDIEPSQRITKIETILKVLTTQSSHKKHKEPEKKFDSDNVDSIMLALFSDKSDSKKNQSSFFANKKNPNVSHSPKIYNENKNNTPAPSKNPPKKTKNWKKLELKSLGTKKTKEYQINLRDFSSEKQTEPSLEHHLEYNRGLNFLQSDLSKLPLQHQHNKFSLAIDCFDTSMTLALNDKNKDFIFLAKASLQIVNCYIEQGKLHFNDKKWFQASNLFKLAIMTLKKTRIYIDTRNQKNNSIAENSIFNEFGNYYFTYFEICKTTMNEVKTKLTQKCKKLNTKWEQIRNNIDHGKYNPLRPSNKTLNRREANVGLGIITIICDEINQLTKENDLPPLNSSFIESLKQFPKLTK